jgi:DNA-binding LacI/PurR family transcriptional regulator
MYRVSARLACNGTGFKTFYDPMINGPPTHVDAIERERGFLAGLVEVGMQKLTKRYGDFTIPSGIAAMEDIFKEFRPRIIFLFSPIASVDCLAVFGRQNLPRARCRPSPSRFPA